MKIYFILLTFLIITSLELTAQSIEIKSLEIYTTENRLELPVVTKDNRLVIEFDVKSEFEPALSILFRFCDYGWTPTKNIFLLNQHRNSLPLFNFERLPVTVEDADYHFKGSFPDKDKFIELPFSGKWKFYITDIQDTSLVYAEGRFYLVDNQVEMRSVLKNEELENKTYWPVELAKVFNVTTDFVLPEKFFPGFVDRVEIIQNRNIYYPLVIERNSNTLERQFKWDANRKFTYIIRDIQAGNEYRQVDIRDFNYFSSKDVKAQRDGLEFSRFFLKVQSDMNGNKVYMDFTDPYATYHNVQFSIRPPDEVNGDIFLVGAFNDWKLSPDYKLYSENGIKSITIPLKRGVYDYQFVVAEEEGEEIINDDWLVLEGNTWVNRKVYDIFLYYNETNLGGYERIIGYLKLPREKNE
ncbi:MAG: DUF5103 domain-containing protein [Ignavibacterium sp.]|nr:MAG: DUF5103 domain-containing protein [Ignavibacterium sp.]